MNQTSVIGGALFLAFAIFVVVRGDLSCYLQILGVATDKQCPIGDLTASTTPGTTTASTTVNVLPGTGNSCSGFLGSLECGAGQRIGQGIGGGISGVINNIGCTLLGC